MSDPRVLIDDVAPGVRRLTLNRPEKRNALDNALRAELLAALQAADRDDGVRVSILCGAGKCFSSGYDLGSDLEADQPYFSAKVGQPWARHVSEGWLSIWDLAKPVVAQVHGYAMAGGLELVGACDLAYGACEARFSHPVLQMSGLADFPWFPAKLEPRHAMELHLTGREYDGIEAAQVGLINRAFPEAELEARVLEIAERIASAPAAVRAVQKRYVHTAIDARGGRSLIMTGTDLNAGPHMQELTANAAEILERVKRGRSD